MKENMSQEKDCSEGKTATLDKEASIIQDNPEISAMLKDPDTMKHEVNGTSVKSETLDIKEEIKEEVLKPKDMGPSPNSLTNGSSDAQIKTEEGQPKMKQENIDSSENIGRSPTTNEVQPQLPSAVSQSFPVPPPPQQLHQVSQQSHLQQLGQPPMHSAQQPAGPAEAHFMQQQSQIFVFSTQLANKAAEAFRQGHYKSILQFHMDQPGTKSFLQNFPMKGPHFGRPPGLPIYSMANMRVPNMGMMKNSPMATVGPNPNSSVAQWVQQQNANLQEQELMNMPFNFNPEFINQGQGMMPWQLPGYMPMSQSPMGPGFSMIPDNPGFDPEPYRSRRKAHPHRNLLQNKVPDDKLTPEQLQKREESLANLRKIQQMLFPEHRPQQQQQPQPQPLPPPPNFPPGTNMIPENLQPNMFPHNMSPQPNMMSASQQNLMTSQQAAVMSSHNMMTSHQQFVMSQQNMSQFSLQPPNMDHVNPAQREWVRLQHQFYAEKRRMQQMQLAQQMNSGMDLPNAVHASPPSYYSSVSQKRQGSTNPSTSPIMNGAMLSPPLPGPEPQDPMHMFSGSRRPSSVNPLDQPVLNRMGQPFSPSGYPPSGNMEPHPMIHGPPGPAMSPGGGMNSPYAMPPGKNSHVALQRAGNPEEFQLEVSGPHNTDSSLSSKPPPSYAQSTKRKREDMEEIYKNLQPTPSPQQLNYLNQFEGQELTITKQLNTAYREQGLPPESQNNNFSHNQVHSPMHGPGSNKGPLSNSSQSSSVGPLSSPGPMSGPSPMSGAAMRLSHYDPPGSTCANISDSSTTSAASSNSSMVNITSASLANLAKGVEHLSNQMQQNMMQGGPFHSIQIQGQMAGNTAQQTNNNNNNGNGNGNGIKPILPTRPSSPSPKINTNAAKVNNTYVNATMSIQQLNIQSVNAPSYNPSMQVQQMANETPQRKMGQPPLVSQGGNVQQGPVPQGPVPQSGQVSVASPMSQNQGLMQGMGPSNTTKQFSSPQPGQMSGKPSTPLINPPPARMANSPNFSTNSVGNANIQIQAKAPNTIQYLPANPMPSQTNMINQKRPDLDFMQKLASPLSNLDGKGMPSKIQYFSNNMMGQGMPHMGMGSPLPNHPMGMQQSMMMMQNSNVHNMPPVGVSDPMVPMNIPMGGMDVMGPVNMGGMNSMPGNLCEMPPMDGGMGRFPFNPQMHPGNQSMLNNGMMQAQQISLQGPGMSNMPPMQRPSPGIRMPSGHNIPQPGSGPVSPAGYSAQFQQFQQQLYSQNRPRQLSPMPSMMPSPGQPYMMIMPNMPGPT